MTTVTKKTPLTIEEIIELVNFALVKKDLTDTPTFTLENLKEAVATNSTEFMSVQNSYEDIDLLGIEAIFSKTYSIQSQKLTVFKTHVSDEVLYKYLKIEIQKLSPQEKQSINEFCEFKKIDKPDVNWNVYNETFSTLGKAFYAKLKYHTLELKLEGVKDFTLDTVLTMNELGLSFRSSNTFRQVFNINFDEKISIGQIINWFNTAKNDGSFRKHKGAGDLFIEEFEILKKLYFFE